VAITHDLLFIPTSNLLSQNKYIKRIFEQKIKAIRISVLEKIRSKEKVITFSFEQLQLIIYYLKENIMSIPKI